MPVPSSSPSSEERARDLVRAAINHYLMRYRGSLLSEPVLDLASYYQVTREDSADTHARFLAWVRRQVLWSPVRVVDLSPIQEVSGVPCSALPCGGATVRFRFGPIEPPPVSLLLRGIRFTGTQGDAPLMPMEPELGDGIFVLANGNGTVFVAATRDPAPGRGWPRWLLPLFWPGPANLFELERFYDRVVDRGLYPWPGSARQLAYVTAQVAGVYRRIEDQLPWRLDDREALRTSDGAALVLL